MTTRSKGCIDELLHHAVADRSVPAVVAMAATKEGLTYEGSCGPTADQEQWSPNTVTWLASLTKIIAAVAALQLVERGELDLDASMAVVLPELADAKVLTGFDTHGDPVLRPPAREVSLRHLLTHTSGYGYQFWNSDIQRFQEHEQLPSIVECREATLSAPLLFDPGSGFNYGMNFEWVGKAIEKVSGLSLEKYLQKHIFGPLGMTDTSFVLDNALRSGLADMYVRNDGGFVPIDFEINQEPEFLSAASGLYGSSRDFMCFLQMLLNNGRSPNGDRIIAAETLAEAARNHIGALQVGRFESCDPASSYDVELLPGTPKKWSLLGMFNAEPTPTGRSVGSLSWAGLANSYVWVDWEKSDAGMLVTQLLPFGDPAVLELFDEFERLVHGA